YLIIPGMYSSPRFSRSILIRAFSACTLMLGKLRTRLSDETFRAGLLLRMWHKAGLLPHLEELAQYLKDNDTPKRKHTASDETGEPAKKKARIQVGGVGDDSEVIDIDSD